MPDSFTKLLLHCDGTDASTTFLDSSASAHTVTANGNAQIDTAQSVFGGASGLFDGTGDFLSIPDHADFEIGSGDFTIDLRVRFNTVTAINNTFVRKGRFADADNSFEFSYSGTAVQTLFLSTSTNGIAATTTNSVSWVPSTNTWYHVVVIRTGTTVRFFVNGTQVGADATNSETFFSGGGPVTIGGTSVGANPFDGWQEEIRFSNGVARWTANFTPPISPYDFSLVFNPQRYMQPLLVR